MKVTKIDEIDYIYKYRPIFIPKSEITIKDIKNHSNICNFYDNNNLLRTNVDTLSSDLNFVKSINRILQIMEDSKFHFSSFTDLNDPMEGLYNNNYISHDNIKTIFKKKECYKICSFSGRHSLKSSLMWVHYANEYKGIVFKIKIHNIKNLYKVDYIDYKKIFKPMKNYDPITLLTQKTKEWKHEDEYRYIFEHNLSEDDKKIGVIEKIFFCHRNNYSDENEELKKYDRICNELRDELECRNKTFTYGNIFLDDIIKGNLQSREKKAAEGQVQRS